MAVLQGSLATIHGSVSGNFSLYTKFNFISISKFWRIRLESLTHTPFFFITGWLLTRATGKINNGELRVGNKCARDRAVLPHAPVARHGTLGAAGAGDGAAKRGMAASGPRLLHYIPAILPLTTSGTTPVTY